jgi:RHS repeat-associated protein
VSTKPGQLHGSANLNLAYDAFNMINNVQGGTTDLVHVYTADNERLLSFPATGTTSKWTLRGLGNELLRVYNENENGGSPIWSHDTDYMYQGSQMLASHSASAGTRYFYLDHLGTPRLIKDSAGQVLASHDYYPFGEELVSGLDQERKKFTGHERDFNGSGVDDDLDYMHARYFAPELGRFLGPDPAASSYTLAIPQSWNRFAYVLNNPLRFFDPNGLQPNEPEKDPGPVLRGDGFGETIAVTGAKDPRDEWMEDAERGLEEEVDPTGGDPPTWVTNNSGRGQPYKPGGRDGIDVCAPGETCNVDGVYPNSCDRFPIKMVNGCGGEWDTEGRLRIWCTDIVSWCGQMTIGGRTTWWFHRRHEDWPMPNGEPTCGVQCEYPPASPVAEEP